ncbi:MAG: acyl carrier protein [Gammaproteobacteria bacterium]|nr:acyl carrier protein [Gammaproteobacteria bacterium]MDJ0871719.1 acyl carrier protein [Gammaproteobacteria bacterium]MDJ0891441.1 acyl carrier protein [Gammaproteobacteria bacterium]
MSSRAEILDQVYEVLRPHAKKGQALTEDTELVGDLNLDSVQVLELLLEIEDHFDISIPLNALPDIHTVKDLAGELEKIAGSVS